MLWRMEKELTVNVERVLDCFGNPVEDSDHELTVVPLFTVRDVTLLQDYLVMEHQGREGGQGMGVFLIDTKVRE